MPNKIGFRGMRRVFIAAIMLMILFLMMIFTGSAQTTQMGDVNGDGKVDVQDVVLIMKHVLKIQLLSAEQQKYADFSGDGEININDAVFAMKKALGLEHFLVSIIRVEDVTAINAPFGTNYNLINFPDRVSVILGDGSKKEVGVKWSEISRPVFDPLRVDAYTFNGTLVDLPSGVTNPSNLTASIIVVVFIPTTYVPEPGPATQ